MMEHIAFSTGLQEDNLMAMMTVYFDDSGTHAESEIAIAACFISDTENRGIEIAEVIHSRSSCFVVLSASVPAVRWHA